MEWEKENAEILAIRNRLKGPQSYTQLVADSRTLLDYIDRQHEHIARMVDNLRAMIGEM